MFSVRGIYDGKAIKITDKFTEKKKYKVVITFIEELEQGDKDLRDFSAQTKGLDFWSDSSEDLYQDYLNSKEKSK
jgi:hypothetical protein